MSWQYFLLTWFAIGFGSAWRYQPQMGGPATLLMILLGPLYWFAIGLMFAVIFLYEKSQESARKKGLRHD